MSKITNVICEENRIKIITNQGYTYTISKNKITNMIRPITNASAFFSLDTENCFFKRRTFKL